MYAQSVWLTLVVSKLVLLATVLAPRVTTRPVDSAIAVGLLLLCLLVELAFVHLPRVAYGGLFALLLVGAVWARHLAPSSLLGGALLLLEHLYGGDASHTAPIQMVLAATAAALFAWQRLQLSRLTSRWASGLTVAVGLYVMFWPTVGFHLVGLDFAYMFQWVPAESYERAWWIIGLGAVVKLALPLMLVVAVAREELRDAGKSGVVTLTFAAKGALLSLMIASFAVRHDMSSEQALAMLAELILVMFGVCACVVVMPARTLAVESTSGLDFWRTPCEAGSLRS